MDSSKLNDWMQVVGIFAVVASLVFVGLQLKQSQDIAASAVVQSRTSDSIALRLAPLSSPALRSAQAKIFGMTEGELTADEQLAYSWFFWSELIYIDNMHYQYISGYLTEEQWSAHRGDLVRLFSDSFVRDLWEVGPNDFKQSFLAVIDQVIEEIDAGR